MEDLIKLLEKTNSILCGILILTLCIFAFCAFTWCELYCIGKDLHTKNKKDNELSLKEEIKKDIIEYYNNTK